MPSLVISPLSRRESPKLRMRSSSNETKNFDDARIALARATSAQLPVDAARFVPLRADDVKPAGDMLALARRSSSPARAVSTTRFFALAM